MRHIFRDSVLLKTPPEMDKNCILKYLHLVCLDTGGILWYACIIKIIIAIKCFYVLTNFCSWGKIQALGYLLITSAILTQGRSRVSVQIVQQVESRTRWDESSWIMGRDKDVMGKRRMRVRDMKFSSCTDTRMIVLPNQFHAFLRSNFFSFFVIPVYCSDWWHTQKKESGIGNAYSIYNIPQYVVDFSTNA